MTRTFTGAGSNWVAVAFSIGVAVLVDIWAVGLLEARGSMGLAGLRYTEAVLANLRSAGFPLDDAVHAFWLLDSYVYGHVIQETSLASASPSDDGAPVEQPVADHDALADYPNLAELGRRARESGYSVDREFAYGLDLILDALERTVAPTPG